jgi:hypothetical protein
LISGDWLDKKNFEESEEETLVKRILDPNDNMDNEKIDIQYIMANIKKYFKVLLKLDVNDSEFFRIIRLKNQNVENIKDHFYDDIPVKEEELKELVSKVQNINLVEGFSSNHI